MTSTFTLNIMLSGVRDGVWGLHSVVKCSHIAGELSNPGLINFGQFTDLPYTYYEMPFFIILGMLCACSSLDAAGVFGGLLGALFIFLNKNLTMFRRKYIQTPKSRCLSRSAGVIFDTFYSLTRLCEVIILTIVTTATAFMLVFSSTVS
jgi:chloride channel 7